MSNTKKPATAANDSHNHQVTILRSMASDGGYGKQLLLSEILERSGIDDEKEVQRYLYILEGQKLVTPMPEGDFTSKNWQITRDGVRILKLIASSKTQ